MSQRCRPEGHNLGHSFGCCLAPKLHCSLLFLGLQSFLRSVPIGSNPVGNPRKDLSQRLSQDCLVIMGSSHGQRGYRPIERVSSQQADALSIRRYLQLLQMCHSFELSQPGLAAPPFILLFPLSCMAILLSCPTDCRAHNARKMDLVMNP